jgi:transposase
MRRMTDPAPLVTGGVDTHADVHVAAAVCSTSHQLLGTATFPTTPVGYVQMLAWWRSFGQLHQVGIEGTGTYGAGLARFLTAEGVKLVEVDRPDRVARRLQGKSDPIDAEAAARAVLSGRATGTPKSRDGMVEAIRAMRVVYRGAVKDRTAAINQFHALTTTAPDPIRDQLLPLRKAQRIQTAARWRERAGDEVVVRTTRLALRELARRITLLTEQADRCETELKVLVEQLAPALLDVRGVGVHTAAQLLITAGDNPDRIRSEAAFAHLCGVAPIPASSGRTHRHRLNKGGDRAANHALWRIALVRLSIDDRTRRYAARRTTEGLSERDVMRCLKRYIAREIHRVLTRPPAPAPRGPQLAALRHQLGIKQSEIAHQLEIAPTDLSRIENGHRHRPDLQRRILTHLLAHAT